MGISAVIWLAVSRSLLAMATAAEEGYIRAEGSQWTLGTATVERVVALEEGKLLLKSLKDKVTGRELISSGTPSEEFFVRLPAPGRHTLEIQVLGQHNPRAKGSLVALDGVRIEP